MWLVHTNPNAREIEARPHQVERERFRQTGVVLVRGLFDPTEARAIRRQAEVIVERAYRENRHVAVEERHPGGRSIRGDLLSMRELAPFHHVLLDPRVVSVAKRLLGDDVTYFGESSIRVGTGGRGFHKDFFAREDGPTQSGLRFVLYLQDHVRASGGLKIRLGSHRFESRHLGRMMNVPTRLGDLVVFSLRAAHTGHNVRLRLLPQLCLHPKLENLVPSRWRLGVGPERLCLLWTFAAPGRHIQRYLDYIAQDPTPWRDCAYHPELVELAARHGVTLMKAVPEHGSDA